MLNNDVPRFGSSGAVTLLTTRRGLNAMGFSLPRVDNVTVYADSQAMNEEEEKALSESVQSILRRADNLSFYDQLETVRANRQNNRMIMTALISVALPVLYYIGVKKAF